MSNLLLLSSTSSKDETAKEGSEDAEGVHCEFVWLDAYEVYSQRVDSA